MTIAEHVAIYEAVEKADATAAKNAMRKHLIGAASRVNLDLDIF